MAKVILTNKGSPILVSDEDYEWLSKYTWYLGSDGYAVRAEYSPDKQNNILHRMHREIIGASDSEYVDHIDGNRLDNTRENLRKCTFQENLYNTAPRENASSKYKGVRIHNGVIRMTIIKDRKIAHQHCFNSEECAAAAYNYYAKELFGEYARLNDVDIPKEIWEADIRTKNSKRNGVKNEL
jgi:hypothetical protein